MIHFAVSGSLILLVTKYSNGIAIAVLLYSWKYSCIISWAFFIVYGPPLISAVKNLPGTIRTGFINELLLVSRMRLIGIATMH